MYIAGKTKSQKLLLRILGKGTCDVQKPKFRTKIQNVKLWIPMKSPMKVSKEVSDKGEVGNEVSDTEKVVNEVSDEVSNKGEVANELSHEGEVANEVSDRQSCQRSLR